VPRAEIVTDAAGKKWKIVVLPDKSGGETVLAVEVKS